jgi:hypothetical protein
MPSYGQRRLLPVQLDASGRDPSDGTARIRKGKARWGPDARVSNGILLAWHHEPIAPWQTEAWLNEMRSSLRPNQFLRMIENRFVTGESSFVDLEKWDACVDPDATPIFNDTDLSVFIGVDASVKRDSTAIVAVTKIDQRVRLVRHYVFQPSPETPLDFEAAIEETLIDLCGRFKIARIWFDPYQLQATMQRLQKRGLPVREFPQTVSNLTVASQNLYELIEARSLLLYPDVAMRLSASRAIAIETVRGWRIAKEKQSHKIDVIVALAMAAHAVTQNREQVIPFVAPFVVSNSNPTGNDPYDVSDRRSATAKFYDYYGASGRDTLAPVWWSGTK